MRIAITLAAILCVTGAEAESLWDHNGSTVELEASGAGRKFFYQTPRRGLPVKAGTLLFEGKKKGKSYIGTAYSFSSRCGAKGFTVDGSISGDQKTITMHGKAPRFNQKCNLVGYRQEKLIFNYQKIETSEKSIDKIPLHLGKTAIGFHIPQQYDGKIIFAGWPNNEHTIHAIEDMMALIGAEHDILILETSDNIGNAYAVIDGKGKDARRMIVFDEALFDMVGRQGGDYRVILAHEIGHHICRHTLEKFLDGPWEEELEADRTAGAIMRKAHEQDYGIGGAVVSLDDIVASVRAFSSETGSRTHPPRDKRIGAYVNGWNDGSQCLHSAYVPINPAPKRDPTVIERIKLHYGDDMLWDFRGSCARTVISGNQLSIVFETPRGEHKRAGAKRGSLIFKGTSDKENIRGTLWNYESGCQPISYDADDGYFVENNFINLGGKPPRMSGCRAVGDYTAQNHLFKNTSDYAYESSNVHACSQ